MQISHNVSSLRVIMHELPTLSVANNPGYAQGVEWGKSTETWRCTKSVSKKKQKRSHNDTLNDEFGDDLMGWCGVEKGDEHGAALVREINQKRLNV